MPDACPVCGEPYGAWDEAHVCKPAEPVEGQQPMFESDPDE